MGWGVEGRTETAILLSEEKNKNEPLLIEIPRKMNSKGLVSKNRIGLASFPTPITFARGSTWNKL